MRLNGKNIIVYGAAGAIGSAVARAFGREGAHVFLTGRRLDALDAVAKEIPSASTAVVDALDPAQVAAHAAQVGRIDVSFNAIGIPQEGIQGVPMVDLPLEGFQAAVHAYLTAHFVTARTVARHMGSGGAILTVTATPGHKPVPHVGGMAPAWAGMEAISRTLAAELGPAGIRVACLRAEGIPETATIDTVFGLHAEAIGRTRAEFTSLITESSLLKRLPTLADVAQAAVFLASDEAAALTGTVLNISAGSATD
ncbi:SDR family oxidoreductase [Actinoplanes sp. NPDC051861]|uniref:SDR family NAD(P)-dependent oxidoreductase n=1 Tax=Actinoplanes sp. NPDC051861 TaxID=3155170 RepID=UPI003413D7CD